MRDTTDSEADLRVVAQVDTAIQLYRDLGFSSERIAAQLARSGYPLSLIRERFPDVPERVFPAPQTRRARSRQSSSPPASAPSVPTAAVFVPSVIAEARRLESSRTPTVAIPAESSPAGGIAFQYVPLIQCSFPHADPGELRTFTRRNGWLELTLSTARPDTGLPYGVPARLLTIYCASEAIRTRSPEIFLGRSVHEFLRRLDVPITRGERGSLRIYANQLLRLIHCAVSIDENIRDASGRTGLHIRQALFAEEARLWWDEGAGVGQGSSFVLSPVLFQSILERSAPLSTAAIRQLRKSPMDLDVYAWLVHRLFHLSRSSALSWEQLSGQFGHSYGEIRYFRRFFGDSLQRVLKVYPEAKVKPTETGLLLMPSRPHVVQRSNPERA
jgi:Plasmid encoded RepA protein